jgi:hypothetical protein
VVYESVIRLLQLVGCVVYRLSQARASRQTAGVPDLMAFGPGQRFCWIEVKRPGGRLRPEQRAFREQCQARGIEHVVGGLPEVERLLVQWDLADALPSGGILVRARRAG